MLESEHSASRPVRLYRTHGALALSLAAALLLSLVLFAGGGAGLSNNGDFGRVMSTNSLEFVDGNLPYLYQDTFRMVFRGETGGEKLWNLLFSTDQIQAYPSIHLVFVRASLLGNLALNALTGAPLDNYHIQVLGLLYLLCYAALLFLLFRSFQLEKPWLDLLVKLLFLFVLCDEGYVAYFNSLYSEPVQILGLLAMAVFALRCLTARGRRLPNALFFFLACVFYGWSKFINIPVAALCAAGLSAALVLRTEKRQWKWLIGGGVLCIAVLGAVYLSLPGWMDYETNYNSVFYGILKDASPQQQVDFLDDLGLPRSMAGYADSNYYMDRAASARESDAFRADFSRISKFDLLFFYLRRPGYFLEKLNVAMAHSGFIRPYYLANLGPGHPRLSFACRFGGWSWVRSQLPFDAWVFNGLILAAGCVCLWPLLAGGKNRKCRVGAAVLLLTLLGCVAYQFLMPVVTNGEGDLAKHMFAFAQFIDLLLLLLLARLGAALCRVKRLKYPTPALAGGLAAVIVLSLSAPAAVRSIRDLLPHALPEQGAYVRLGAYGGKPLLWQVVDTSDGTCTLLAAEAVGQLPFSDPGSDGYGSSLWTASALRLWLNGPFLEEAFTASERASILNEERRVLLAGPYRDRAESGYNDFFAFHVPAWSDRGMDAAVAEYSADSVRLPDIHMLADLSRAGLLCPVPCWMETPYFNNGSMLRTVGTDGYFYMRDASESWGVRPVITVAYPGTHDGSGARADPFVW